MTGPHEPLRLSVLAAGIDHAESVAWDPSREVLFAGGEAGQIYAVSLDGTVEEVGASGGSLLGVAVAPAGPVVACDAGGRCVVRFDPDTGSCEVCSTGLGDGELVEPNGIAIAAAGEIYFTDSGNWGGADGSIHRIGVDGETVRWVDRAFDYPNGCAVVGDDLLVVESGKHRVLRVPIGPDGSAGEVEVLHTLPPSLPDQVAPLGGDSLLIGCYRPDRIYRVSRSGVEVVADDPYGVMIPAPTGVAVAGPELETVVIAAFGGTRLVEGTWPAADLAAARPGSSTGPPSPDR